MKHAGYETRNKTHMISNKIINVQCGLEQERVDAVYALRRALFCRAEERNDEMKCVDFFKC